MAVLRNEAEIEAEVEKIVYKAIVTNGRKTVYRKVIYGILEYQFDLIGKALTRKIMDSVAAKFGGIYIHNEKGTSRIEV